jgi:hypothetical protein
LKISCVGLMADEFWARGTIGLGLTAREGSGERRPSDTVPATACCRLS